MYNIYKLLTFQLFGLKQQRNTQENINKIYVYIIILIIVNVLLLLLLL